MFERFQVEAGGDIADDIPSRADVDPSSARWLRRHLPAGVVVVTTRTGETFRASTVSACMSVSVEPALLLVSIDLDSQMDAWLLEAQAFGVNILPWREQFLADQFAGFTPLASSRFEGIDHFIAGPNVPILAGSLAWAACAVNDDFVTGDHRCFVGQAIAIGAGGGDRNDPLIYFRNRYRGLR